MIYTTPKPIWPIALFTVVVLAMLGMYKIGSRRYGPYGQMGLE